VGSGFITVSQPILVKFLTELAHPPRRQAEPSRDVLRSLADQKFVHEPSITLAAAVPPIREIDAEYDLVGHWRLGIILERVEEQIPVAAVAFGQPLDQKAVALLRMWRQH